MMRYGNFEKKNESDQIWWGDALDEEGQPLIGPNPFTFDLVKIYNFWCDYPDKLTPEEKEIFDKECPYWAKFKQP